ncbi:hypothetical protein IFM89_009784 [Coptis chinensis]|uniref:Pentatricopeptide repeat-containing protein n=1 Tax=Coptis chinensis TaxID=261450 RepID=A0A835I1R3_9MAGN|nr:hypothetical protein IFM89_009784 [Coptis chinensis]
METTSILSGGLVFQPLITHSLFHTTHYYRNRCQLTSTGTSVNEFEFIATSTATTPTLQIASNNPKYAKRAAILNIQRAPDLGSALARYGEILEVQDLNIILRHYGTKNKWKDVSMIFDWMRKHDKINFASYSSFIKFMGKGFNPVKALEVYNSIQDDSLRTNVSICNSILGCLVKNGKFESAIKLFDEMKRGGLIPDVVTYSTLLAGCRKDKNGYPKAMHLVEELKRNRLQMDDVIYGTLLAVCASNNRCKEAEEVSQLMKDDGFKPNVFHYSSLLNAYAVDGNHTKADSLVKEMKSEGLVPNKVIMTTLLKVYVRGGLFEKSRQLLLELETLGFACDEMPYCLLMDGLAKAGHVNEAKAIFNEMVTKDVKSDGYSDSIMISAYCRSGLLHEAKQLARDFEARHERYDLVMLNTMLRAYCKAGEMESVMQMLRKMDELKISPDWNTFHILIKYFYKEKLYQLAYRTMVDMHSKGHQPDEELCSSLILQLGRVGAPSEAFSCYNMLRYSKRTMNKALHGKMLNILVAGGILKDAYVVVKDNADRISHASLKKFAVSFMKKGNINLINDVVKAVHGSGHKIDQEVFCMAVSRYIEEPEKKDLLLQLLHWMTGQGYVVDPASRNLVLKNADLFGRHLIAEILSKQHKMSKLLRTQQTESRTAGSGLKDTK